MSTNPPPAYSAPSQQGPPPAYAGDGSQSKAPKPKKQRPPDAPAPDGEGPLGPPLKRMMYIGVALSLYYILAFWMPVYWMRGASLYCEFRCSQYQSLSSSASEMLGSSINYGSGAFGCYESTDPTCEDTCETDCDICDNLGKACTDVEDLAYELAYYNSGRTVRLVSFALSVLGIAFGFVGCILGYFAVKKGSYLYSRITTGLLGLGGLMVIAGAIIFLATWHDAIDFEELIAAAQILVLMEWLLPSIIAIVLAVDVYDPSIFNDERKRMMAMTAPFAVGGITCGILMAYIINWEPEMSIGYDFALYDQGGCIAAGYFIVGLMCIARIAIWGEYVKVSDNPASVITAKFMVSVLLCIGAIILACGYWAFIGKIFDCELVYSALTSSTTTQCEGIGYLTWINGDAVSLGMVLTDGIPYEGQFKCYYVAYTFFMLLISAILAYDMSFMSNYRAVRTAQKAASR